MRAAQLLFALGLTAGVLANSPDDVHPEGGSLHTTGPTTPSSGLDSPCSPHGDELTRLACALGSQKACNTLDLEKRDDDNDDDHWYNDLDDRLCDWFSDACDDDEHDKRDAAPNDSNDSHFTITLPGTATQPGRLLTGVIPSTEGQIETITYAVAELIPPFTATLTAVQTSPMIVEERGHYPLDLGDVYYSATGSAMTDDPNMAVCTAVVLGNTIVSTASLERPFPAGMFTTNLAKRDGMPAPTELSTMEPVNKVGSNHGKPNHSKHDNPGHSKHEKPGHSKHDTPGHSEPDMPGNSEHDTPDRSRHDNPDRSKHDNTDRSKQDRPGHSKDDKPAHHKHDKPAAKFMSKATDAAPVSFRTEVVSSLDNDPPLVVKKVYAGPYTSTETSTINVWPRAEKRAAVETVTVLDEQPGHKILNKVAAGQPTTEVTVVDHEGTKLTLKPSTNPMGEKVLVTDILEDSGRHTHTATVIHDSDGTSLILPPETSTNLVTRTDVVTTTVHVFGTIESPTTTVEGSIFSNDAVVQMPTTTVEGSSISMDSVKLFPTTTVEGSTRSTDPVEQLPTTTVQGSTLSTDPVEQLPTTTVQGINISSDPPRRTVYQAHIVTTITKVPVETVTQTGHGWWQHHPYADQPGYLHHDPHGYGAGHSRDGFMPTRTMADLGSTTVPVTKGMQFLNNGTMLVVAPHAEATLMPLVWRDDYFDGWEHLMTLHLDALRSLYQHADWEVIPVMAHHLRLSTGETNTDPELHLKQAFVMWMRRSQPQYAHHYQESYPEITRNDRDVVTKTMAHIKGHDYSITAPTQKINGYQFVADPLLKYKMFDPRHHAVAPTGSCEKGPRRPGMKYEGPGDDDDDHEIHSALSGLEKRGHSDKGNRTVEKHQNEDSCMKERCMWDYLKPINITTVAPMAMYDHYGDMVYDYFTHTTELHRPHWGTKDPHGLYYPTYHTWVHANGTATHHVARQTPASAKDTRHGYKVHGDPHCWDVESCYKHCDHEHEHDLPFDPKLIAYIAGPIIALALLGLLFLCCMRRPKRDRRDSQPTIAEKIRRMSTKKPDEVVHNTVTGTTTDQHGNVVDPATAPPTATLAGPAAGAAAARESDGSDEANRGTTARRAEEGRGRVNFADPPAPEAKEVGSASGPAPAESTAPVPVHDGTADTTGMQTADMGSVRGRKRSRPEGALAGLGIF
ncbi:hypothetical protein LTR37_000640 [Vermiconidia calcicola]|uniref:Uncharacterized protein n=1 Tax=Vermiconidia calcicola TaxID=1690605 RepID=A0ACC3NXS9_9PEZI|nr:hypothetical protein LTR37_000640 [Vermiconidia calcicola]